MKFVIKYIWLITIVIFVFNGCNSPQKAVKSKEFNNLLLNEFKPDSVDTEARVNIAKQIMTNASVYKQQGRYAEAILEYQEALRWDTSASIYYAMSESYWALGKRISSIENCNKSIKLDSTFIPAYELLFNIYSTDRKFKEAYIVADQILAIDPTRDNKIRYAVLKSFENPAESIKMLESILKDSTDSEILYLLSSAYEQTSQFDKMIVILERLHKDQPTNFDVTRGILDYYSNLGDIQNTFRVLDNSEKYFSPTELTQVYNNIGINLISTDPESNSDMIKKFIKRIDERFYFDWVTQSVSAKLSSNISDTNNTDKFYSRAFFLNDTNAFLYLDAAIAYSNLKLNEKAIEKLSKGKEKFPDDIRFDFYLSNSYLMTNDYDKALLYGKKAFETDSTNVLFISLYASILQSLEIYNESDRLYEKAIQLDPNDANTANNYAYSLSVRGVNLSKAQRLSQLSINAEPENSAYLDTYGWIQYQLGNYNSALEFILKAIEIGDVSAEVFDHLGDIYLKLNDKEAALGAYNKSLELDDKKSSKVIDKINLLKN